MSALHKSPESSFLSRYTSAIVTIFISILSFTIAIGVAKSQINDLTTEVQSLKLKHEITQQKIQTIEVDSTMDRELLKYISKNVDEIKVDIKELQKNDRTRK
jgi:5-bromo-4-chloroindolyl phosphate hydrolysis protein